MSTYHIHHGIYPRKGYVVVNYDTKKIVFQSHSKTEAIADSQERNGFSIVDGDEETYGKQTGSSAAIKKRRI